MMQITRSKMARFDRVKQKFQYFIRIDKIGFASTETIENEYISTDSIKKGCVSTELTKKAMF